jgi:glyoxylase-like metal-dependent hydrolase (beta-lactamase superfamily II)
MTAAHPAVLEFPHSAPPAPGTTIEVAVGLHWLRMPLPFALDHINLWLLDEGEGWTLIDTGYGDAATRALWEQHFAMTMRGLPLRQIVATHCHPDHLGNAAWLSARFACPIVMTHTEFLAAHAILTETAAHGPRDTCDLFRRHGMAGADVEALAALGNRYARGVPVAPESARRLLAGDAFIAGDRPWRIIVGYGHSPEHASLYARAPGVLVSGDMLLPRITTNVSVWPSDPDGDPLGRFLDSLAAFESLPPETLVLPSHGLPFRGIPLRVEALRAHHRARLAELEEAVAKAGEPVSATQMIPVLFRRPLDVHQRFFAMGEAIAHLNHLWHRERLSRTLSPEGQVRFAT